MNQSIQRNKRFLLKYKYYGHFNRKKTSHIMHIKESLIILISISKNHALLVFLVFYMSVQITSTIKYKIIRCLEKNSLLVTNILAIEYIT